MPAYAARRLGTIQFNIRDANKRVLTFYVSPGFVGGQENFEYFQLGAHSVPHGEFKKRSVIGSHPDGVVCDDWIARARAFPVLKIGLERG